MNNFREVLFGKVDLDTLTVGLVMGIMPGDQNLRLVKGSASAEELKDPSVLCIECGGTGRTDENNFDHHPQKGETKLDLSAAAQALERLANLVRYVDEVDRGIRPDADCRFPSLVSLISGMKLVVKDPEEQMRKGLTILRSVLQSGLDPYGCMEKIVDWMPEVAEWIEAKRQNEKNLMASLQSATWLETLTGVKIAAVETCHIGAPGALYGKGAHVVISLNPNHSEREKVYRKFTVAVNRGVNFKLSQATEELNKLEAGWGGPTHATIIGSPQGEDSQLSLQTVADVVTKSLQGVKISKTQMDEKSGKERKAV